MASSKQENTFEPVAYTKAGVDGERIAYTPADAVHLEFEGWTTKDGKPAAGAKRGAGSPGTSTSGGGTGAVAGDTGKSK